MTTEAQEMSDSKTGVRRSLKRRVEVEEVWLVDASKEGNVSRFINVSWPEPKVHLMSKTLCDQTSAAGWFVLCLYLLMIVVFFVLSPLTAQLPAEPFHPERLHGLSWPGLPPHRLLHWQVRAPRCVWAFLVFAGCFIYVLFTSGWWRPVLSWPGTTRPTTSPSPLRPSRNR